MLKKYQKFILLIISFLFLPTVCKAEDNIVYFRQYDFIRSKVVSTGITSDLRIFSINDSIAYTLNAEEQIVHPEALKDEEYIKTIGSEKLEYMRKIALFGYNDTQDSYCNYMAAQELIWELMMNEDIIWEDIGGNKINVDLQKESILSRIKDNEEPAIIKTRDVYGLYLSDINIENNKSYYDSIKVENNSNNEITEFEDMINLIIHESTTEPIKIIKEYKTENVTSVFKPINSGRLITFAKSKKVIEEINIFMEDKVNSYIELNFQYNGEPIDGAVTFQLIGEETYTYKTDRNGYFISDDVYEEGQYKIKVTEIPRKYVLLEPEFEITIKDDFIDSEQKVTHTKDLKLKTGVVELTRNGNLETGLVPINNSVFELYRIISKNIELINTYQTDDNGKIEIENIPVGRYYLIEKSLEEYELYNEKISFEIEEQDQIIKKEIITDHLPLKIIINETQNYNYYLVDEDNNRIKEIKANELNQIRTKYGNYTIEIYKDEKKIYSWDLLFDQENDEYTFTMKKVSEPIIFDMPKTGRKQYVSTLFFLFLTLSTKLIYLKKVKY